LSKHSAHIRAAKAFIDVHLPQHFSIARIAMEVGVNEQALKKEFKEIYGMGLYAYLQDRILDKSRAQLEKTNRLVKQIAREAGYNNPNNFSAAFKKKFGLSPAVWRTKSREKNP
jgi:AraC-like DNA-binding protein